MIGARKKTKTEKIKVEDKVETTESPLQAPREELKLSEATAPHQKIQG